MLLTSRRSQNWYFFLRRELLKYHNSRITCTCKWNLVQLYTTSTPSISRKMTVPVKGGGGGMEGVYKKPWKNAIQFNKISTLTSNKNSLKNAMNVGFFLLSSSTIPLYNWQRDGVRGEGNPPYGGCFLLVIYIYLGLLIFSNTFYLQQNHHQHK